MTKIQMDLTNAPTMSQTSVVLWKDIWWIKSIVLFLIFVLCCLSYQVLVTIVRFFYSGKAENVENEIGTDATSQSVHNTAQSIINTDENIILNTARPQVMSHAAQTPNSESMNHLKTMESEEDDMDQFHDLVHHGINFYDDNMSSSSRHRRTRMHSTVSEASMVSMVRHHQRPGPTVLNPPPFPKLDESFNESGSTSTAYDQHFSSGDMRFSTQVNPSSHSRLSTVMEEDSNMDSTKLHNRASHKNTDNGYKSPTPAKRVWNTENERAIWQANQRPEKLLSKSIKNEDATLFERDKKVSQITSNYRISCSKPACSVDNVTTTSMTPCPSLVVDKNSRSLSHSANLECSICKSKIHCLCKNCSSFCVSEGVSQEFARPFNNDDAGDTIDDQDYPEIQEEFIDENFEDMESIVTDEITDSKSENC